MNARLPIRAALSILLLTAAPLAASAGEVIAHPSVTLSAEEVRELFFGDKQFAGNLKLLPVDNAAQQGPFQAAVLQTDGAKYTARWTKKAFREGLTAPPVKGSDAETIAYVRATPGAVGYVAGAVGSVKVLLRY